MTDSKRAEALPRQVSVVITDLDNTLFDWLRMWHSSFSAMLAEVQKTSRKTTEELELEFQKIHQRHQTSEYAFAIQELPSLRELHPKEDLTELYASAIDAYRRARRATLKLYPGVSDTLTRLRGKGCLIVGYTESLGYYSNYRVRRLGLDGVLDYLFSPEDHDIPAGLSSDQLRKYPAASYSFRHTIHLHTPRSALKPNPAILRDIIDTIGAKVGWCLYVGDSRFKDVQMAKELGVLDVHAAYGEAHGRSEYDLLKRVTHWKSADVKAELNAASNADPTYSINRFADLETIADFVPFPEPLRRQQNLPPSVLEAWKKTTDVQQHFNDLALRVRSFAITVATTAMGAIGYLWTQREPRAALLIGLAGLVGWIAFWFMDRHWYHRLLLGSVRHGESIEDRYGATHPELRLSQKIREESQWMIGSYAFHSRRRLDTFYFVGAGLLAGAAVLAFTLQRPAADQAAGSRPATNTAPTKLPTP